MSSKSSRTKKANRSKNDPRLDKLVQRSLRLEIQKKYDMAYSLYAQAASEGNAYALWKLGTYHSNGWSPDGRASERNALKYYEKAAKAGIVEAMVDLGYCYDQGVGGVKVDYKKAMDWWGRAIQADGNGTACANIGVMFEYGKGMKENIKDAIYWYNMGVKKLDAHAMFCMAKLYRYGNGVQKNEQTAFDGFEAAAKSENPSPDAFYELYRCYREGAGVKRDSRKAMLWLGRAAEAGIPEAVADLADLQDRRRRSTTGGKSVPTPPPSSSKRKRNAAASAIDSDGGSGGSGVAGDSSSSSSSSSLPAGAGERPKKKAYDDIRSSLMDAIKKTGAKK